MWRVVVPTSRIIHVLYIVNNGARRQDSLTNLAMRGVALSRISPVSNISSGELAGQFARVSLAQGLFTDAGDSRCGANLFTHVTVNWEMSPRER